MSIFLTPLLWRQELSGRCLGAKRCAGHIETQGVWHNISAGALNIYFAQGLHVLLQEVDRMQEIVETLRSEAHAALGRCEAAENAKDSAEKAAADASAQLVTLQLELQTLRGAQSRALADAQDFDQRVAVAVAGKTCI